MEKKRVRFGIIGFGIFGEKRLIPGFKKSKYSELIGISKRSKKAAEDKARQYNIPKFFNDIDELLQDDEIDAVFIATPNNLHLENTIAAANAGKHIILEKPMGMSQEECRMMIDAANKGNVMFMIAHCMRFSNIVIRLKEMVDSKEIGDIVSMNANFFFDATKSSREWLFDANIAGGGPIPDLAVHLIDTLRFISGKEIKDIKFFKEYTLGESVESKAQIILQMEDNIEASIGVGFEGSYYTSLEIIGTNFTVRAPYFNQIEGEIVLTIYKNFKIETEIIKNGNCYTAEIDTFAQSILNNTEVPIPAEEGLINQMILDVMLK